MRPLSSLGIGLSLVFGCLVMALVAEIYYLLWWKRRTPTRDLEGDSTVPPIELCCFCSRKPSLWRSTALNPRELCASTGRTEDSEDAQHQTRSNASKEELMEEELLELHNLTGPARFLFTIKEETKEDMESEDGRSRGDESRKGSSRRSMGDVPPGAETPPFLTPLSSPPFFTPPLTPLDCRSSPHGFSPLSETWKEDDRRRVRSSPPPKLKFLKDAEEKLYRKTLMEEAMRAHRNGAQ
uniref:Titin n=1 Tax=Anthurium amnicola TaxID=1678845 RepID=A0A1D1ZIH8_9ARAE